MHRAKSLAAGVLLTGIAFAAMAENATHVDGYTIHHNALTTASLAPQVAKAYGIRRSKNHGLLNVSVIKDGDSTATGTPVKASVSATASNLSGQTKNIEMREVTDGEAIYYLGEVRVANQETLNFHLQVTPEGASRSYDADLTQQFFTD